MESSSLRGHTRTPLCHLHSPPFRSLLPSPIFALLWPQFSSIGLCFSSSPPQSPGGTFWLLSTPPRVPGVPFWWHLEPHHKWGSWLGYTPLLECDAPGTGKEATIKRKIIKNNDNYKLITHLEGYTRQSCLALTHLSQGLAPSIFTTAPLRYFPSCFPLAFLEGRCTSSSQSHWRYFIILFFLFSSSATLCLLVSSLALASTSLLAFWAVRSAWHNFTTSSSWARSCCYSSCLRCISCCCFSRILVSFCEMLEGEKDIMI